jgi:hypothetical protein
MKPNQTTIGRIIARNCPTCGHHEIGYVDSENTFHPLRPGDMVQVLAGEMMPDLPQMPPGLELNPDILAASEAIPVDLVAWAPEPVKGDPSLRLKYGVLVDREMVAAGMSPGLYGIAYRQKLHRLISNEKYTPLSVLFARFFGVPQLATGTALDMTEALLEELDEVRNPMTWVQNWITQKGEESLALLPHRPELSELCNETVDNEHFRMELEKLTLEAFFEML